MTDASTASPECIFCAALTDLVGEPLVIHQTTHAFVILNKYPYNNGHLMVVPRRHVGRLAGLTADELTDIAILTQQSEQALTAVYHPHGFNMGLNLGKPAGAGVLDHLHMHVVPRWNGDTNFISVVGETRILPEELPQTVDRLRVAFRQVTAREESST